MSAPTFEELSRHIFQLEEDEERKKQAKREAEKRWRDKNSAKVAALAKAWKARNPERAKELNAKYKANRPNQWHKQNKERHNAYKRMWRAKKKVEASVK